MSIFSRMTPLAKILLGLLIIVAVGGAVYYFAPGLTVEAAKSLDKINVTEKNVDNAAVTSDEEALPTAKASTDVSDKPLVRVAGYAWNGQSALIVANGGPKTTKGSLMEKEGVNLEIVRQDWLTELRNLQFKFVEQFDGGNPQPDQGVFAIIIMGDGAPYYISSAQQALDDKFGKGKYHLQVIGAIGQSYGEDKLIGPPSWKSDPSSMKGALISTVLGDGDWVTAVNYVFANKGLKVNPDPSTYDPEAVNFLPSQNDDYMKSAEELIKSQQEGWTVELKEVKNGELTGKTIQKKVDGCATWTPGDKMVFDKLTGFTDIVSTKEFNNQMATTIIAVKEWAVQNEATVNSLLKATYAASNQMKQYDSWAQKAGDCVAKTFDLENGEYWYKMFKGQVGEKAGIKFRMGGTRVYNYADAMQYYGLGGDGVNRYKAVYDQVGKYLVELNPGQFNQNVKRVVPYDEAVNLYFLKSANIADAGVATMVDYTEEATETLASGNWRINFATGSAQVQANSKGVLEEIYNILIQAEDSKLEVTGHTDDVGEAGANLVLSKARANAVVAYLKSRGIPASRFQLVEGRGESEPAVDDTTDTARRQNRRVAIVLKNRG